MLTEIREPFALFAVDHSIPALKVDDILQM